MRLTTPVAVLLGRCHCAVPRPPLSHDSISISVRSSTILRRGLTRSAPRDVYNVWRCTPQIAYCSTALPPAHQRRCPSPRAGASTRVLLASTALGLGWRPCRCLPHSIRALLFLKRLVSVLTRLRARLCTLRAAGHCHSLFRLTGHRPIVCVRVVSALNQDPEFRLQTLIVCTGGCAYLVPFCDRPPYQCLAPMNSHLDGRATQHAE